MTDNSNHTVKYVMIIFAVFIFHVFFTSLKIRLFALSLLPMKSVALILTCLLLPFFSPAQKPLAPEAQKVKDAYEWMMKQPNLPENHIYFIESFPEDKDAYIEVFTPHTFDQLYFDYQTYLSKYRELGRMYPKLVLAKSIAIGKQLHSVKGPAGIMQQTIMELAGINPQAFATEAGKLKKKEQRSLALFLADVANHNDYTQYQELIKEMERLNQPKIADLLIEVRDERMRQ